MIRLLFCELYVMFSVMFSNTNNTDSELFMWRMIDSWFQKWHVGLFVVWSISIIFDHIVKLTAVRSLNEIWEKFTGIRYIRMSLCRLYRNSEKWYWIKRNIEMARFRCCWMFNIQFNYHRFSVVTASAKNRFWDANWL